MRITRAGKTIPALLLAIAGLAACAAPSSAPATTPTTTLPPSATPTAQPTRPSTTPSAEPSPTALPTPQVCSPLAGYTIAQLPTQVANPYLPPPAGSDDPHQGVDLADFNTADHIAVNGMPVQAVLSGQVAGVIQDRFPYGNAILVETPLEDLSPGWIDALGLPAPLDALLPSGALTCPAYPVPDSAGGARSLYVLYGHLLAPPAVTTGDRIECGQAIDKVGQSGNALNPHLHLEVRVGPSGAQFGSMAHYDPSASQEEMGAYCLWRVSGVFQTIDPFCLFGGCSNQP
jgi:murein DD-endopeptidase MepM/ murein hydrolase activator NlpD